MKVRIKVQKFDHLQLFIHLHGNTAGEGVHFGLYRNLQSRET